MDTDENIRLRAHMDKRRGEVADQYREIEAMYQCNTVFNQKKSELNIKSSSFATPIGQYTKYLEGVIIAMVMEKAEMEELIGKLNAEFTAKLGANPGEYVTDKIDEINEINTIDLEMHDTAPQKKSNKKVPPKTANSKAPAVDFSDMVVDDYYSADNLL